MQQFTVYIEPMGKGRPRSTVVAGKPRIYPDPKSAKWEAGFAQLVRDHAPAVPIQGPVSLSIVAVFPRPQRLRRKKDRDGLIYHGQKPDIDNVAKAVMDAMCEFWGDDCQVALVTCSKYFAEKNDRPRITVWIEKLEQK